MWELISRGGPVMGLIVACAFVAIAVFFERLFHLHRAQIRVPDFLEGIFNVVRAGNLAEAVSLCEETPGPVARLMRTAVLHIDEDPAVMERALDRAGLIEIPRIQRRAIVLATVAYMAPLLGLLGTVLGLVEVSIGMHAGAPLVHAGDLAGGLGIALLTTAAGLSVGIPAAAGYNFLLSRVDALLLDMENAASEIEAFHVRFRNRRGPKEVR